MYRVFKSLHEHFKIAFAKPSIILFLHSLIFFRILFYINYLYSVNSVQSVVWTALNWIQVLTTSKFWMTWTSIQTPSTTNCKPSHKTKMILDRAHEQVPTFVLVCEMSRCKVFHTFINLYFVMFNEFILFNWLQFQSPSGSRSQTPKQAKISCYMDNVKSVEKDQLDALAATFFYRCNIPFQVADSIHL